MRKSQKKILINNALMLALAISGLLLLAFDGGVGDKIAGAFLFFTSLYFTK